MTSVDSKKKAVADTLEAAADAVRSAADDGVHTINDLANAASGKLNRDMFHGLRKKVNRNPLRSLAVAAAVGLVAGVSLKATR
jgi:ElaB/YqjD/DUF883 family membrane-anchored ribosome-binding protein